MPERLKVISTEELLHNTPVYLDRRPDTDGPKGRYRYYVTRTSDDEHIGHTRINFFNNGTKELGEPEVWEGFKGKGYGLALYVAANRMPDDFGDCPPLQAQVNFLSSTAERVWHSLVERGLATGSRDYYDPYRFINTDS